MISQTGFRRIHSTCIHSTCIHSTCIHSTCIRPTRALTTAVFCSALVLISALTFYPERLGHAANHKDPRLTLDTEHWRAQFVAQNPQITIDSPVGGSVGLTVTFRWRVQGGPGTETYRYKVLLDKGSNACDNGIEEEFDAGTQTCLRVGLSSNRYLKDTSVDFAIQATDSQDRKICKSGLRFVVDPQLPASALCAASVSAASFLGAELAPESIVAAFGMGLATQTVVATDADPNTSGIQLPTELAGTRVEVRDSAGMTRRSPLFFVAPAQVNYPMPLGTAAGGATITITSGDGKMAAGSAQIAAVAPGVFAANANGQGVAAAVALRIKPDNAQSFEPVARFDQAQNRFVCAPIDFGPEGEQVFLILYGGGWRFRSALSAVMVTIGGVNAEVLFAGAAPGFVGLDQANLRLDRSLAGRGEIDVVMKVDGKTANTVRICIK